MKIIPIAFAFDSNMEMPAGVCLSSLLANAAADTFYDIFILHSDKDDFSESKINGLQKQFGNCRISYRSVGATPFDDGYETRGITHATYYKLLIPSLVPEYGKILYSDVDVVFREDLSEYYEYDLADWYFASVNSVPVMNEDYLSHTKEIGLDPDNGYYYAGNLIINSSLIRKDGLTHFFQSHSDKKYRFQEMDIINLTCCGKIKPLPPAFCLTNNYYYEILTNRERLRTYFSDEEMDRAINTGIVHYNGAKPWKEVCLNMDIWWYYYRKSIFYDERFALDFWYRQTYRVERMSLWKRVKLVGRYFRQGGRK